MSDPSPAARCCETSGHFSPCRFGTSLQRHGKENSFITFFLPSLFFSFFSMQRRNCAGTWGAGEGPGIALAQPLTLAGFQAPGAPFPDSHRAAAAWAEPQPRAGCGAGAGPEAPGASLVSGGLGGPARPPGGCTDVGSWLWEGAGEQHDGDLSRVRAASSGLRAPRGTLRIARPSPCGAPRSLARKQDVSVRGRRSPAQNVGAPRLRD